jgi:hypothetical protein
MTSLLRRLQKLPQPELGSRDTCIATKGIVAIDAKLLSFLWNELSAEHRRGRPWEADRLSREIANDGWATRADMEDVLGAYDGRLYGLDVWALADYLDAPRRYVYRRPRFLTAAASGNEVIDAADAAGILIFLEQIGFSVNAAPMVSAILPAIHGKERLTGSEFDVLVYSKRKGRHLVELRSSSGPGRLEERRLRAINGCRIHAIMVDGEPYQLTVKGPKFRPPRPRESVTCAYCGCEYIKGDREESIAHLSYHAKVKRVVDPRPLRRFLEAREVDTEAEWVTPSSLTWKHREMYRRARQFKREMGFDFVMWGKSTVKDTDPNVHGFLFPDDSGICPDGTIVGACAFRRREDHWGLQWMWLAPKVRRQGILARRWPMFLERFGDFVVEIPLSVAMQAFVRRYGSEAQKRALEPGFPLHQVETQ